jgi:membrane protein YqaA with SNARE-associated domain
MKIFSYLYNKTLLWSGHRHAPYYLASVSFIESFIFPIPPDVMLISMGLAMPKRSWHYALIATLCSVIGGILGYMIGMYAMDILQPYILASSFAPSYHRIVSWFEHSNIWLVVLAGFTPFPYKIFTITAGAMDVPFLPFVLGSLIGRGSRFFLVSGLFYFFGARLESRIRRYIDWLGWVILAIILIGFCLMKWVF